MFVLCWDDHSTSPELRYLLRLLEIFGQLSIMLSYQKISSTRMSFLGGTDLGVEQTELGTCAR